MMDSESAEKIKKLVEDLKKIISEKDDMIYSLIDYVKNLETENSLLREEIDRR